jgi:hypothetical protein
LIPSRLLDMLYIYIYIETCLNGTLSNPKTYLRQINFTIPYTKCQCNLNLCKPIPCFNWTIFFSSKGVRFRQVLLCVYIYFFSYSKRFLTVGYFGNILNHHNGKCPHDDSGQYPFVGHLRWKVTIWKYLRRFGHSRNVFSFCYQWIYNYHLYNQCLSPLKLWVRTPFMARCTRYNVMW